MSRKKIKNIFKICVVGDEGIGKEKFIELFAKRFYVKKVDTALTYGVTFYWESISVNAEIGVQEYRIQIWNFIGSDRFKFLHKSYMFGAKAFMIFFDLGNRDTFEHLNDWLSEVREHIKKDPNKKVPILIVGNKSEMKNFAVSPKDIDNLITKNEVYYIETSTATKEGIFDSFYCITSLILGVEIDNEYFMSRDNIYRQKLSPIEKIPTDSTLTPQDLSNLSQQAIFQKLNLLEKKIDDIKIQDTKIAKDIELREKELKLKERELALMEEEMIKGTEVKQLPEIKESLQVFVSYVSKDGELFKVKEIAKSLTNYKKIERVLFYEDESYDNFIKFMNDNLGKCDVLLLFCSPNALNSEFVVKEWTAADANKIPIIPIFVKLDHIPPLLKSRLGVEFDTFDLQKTIDEIYIVILKKVEKRLIDIRDLKTDF